MSSWGRNWEDFWFGVSIWLERWVIVPGVIVFIVSLLCLFLAAAVVGVLAWLHAI